MNCSCSSSTKAIDVILSALVPGGFSFRFAVNYFITSSFGLILFAFLHFAILEFAMAKCEISVFFALQLASADLLALN
jgi:hypothetical protein